MREGKIMRWRGREREKETLGKRGERERKLFRWDVKKKKKKQDVKEWRKRKKQGAEKKKRVNHKNSDLQEWVGRRKEDGGGGKKSARVRLASLPAVGEERLRFPLWPSLTPPALLLFTQNAKQLPATLCDVPARQQNTATQTHTCTHAHTQTSKRLAGTIRP